MHFDDPPLVAAIMPTRSREILAHQALQMFLDQDWPNKEIVIVDDLDDRSFAITPDFDGVRYHLMEQRLTIGAKRNIAVKNASGPIIVHWDSDDHYREDRITHQVELLISRGVDMVGYNTMEFRDYQTPESRRMYHGAPGYPIGVSMCYWKRIWQARPFADKQIGEDNDFKKGRSTYTTPAGGRIIARIHEGNASDKRAGWEKNPAQWSRM